MRNLTVHLFCGENFPRTGKDKCHGAEAGVRQVKDK